MALIQAEIKRGFLRSLYRAACGAAQNPDNVGLLKPALEAFQDSGFAALKSGKLLFATSAAGKNVQFQAPPIGAQFTQEQVFALTEEFLAVYDSALITLSAASINNPTDAQIFQCMLADDRINAVRSYMVDFTLGRFPWNSATAI